MGLTNYISFFADIKVRIREAQTKATLAANAQMIALYWDIGKIILEKQKQEGWGSSIIKRLSLDLKNDLPEMNGFSERNLWRMLRFANEYAILPQPVALLENSKKPLLTKFELELNIVENQNNEKVNQLVAKLDYHKLLFSIPWGHHLLLIEKIKDLEIRFWYIQQVIYNGWSREVLASMLKSDAFSRKKSITNNFDSFLPSPQSDLVKQTLKDPYIFDFLTLTKPFTERELEAELVTHIQKFLIELGTGFAFVGRQYHFEAGNEDFYIDLLFYHLKMRCFVVVDLKRGDFKPEYAGKMNFYCSVIDDILKHKSDEPTIGLILCENKKKIIAEYTLRNSTKPIGISEYELTRALPENLKSSLPSIEDIENELSDYNKE
ncbi:YhcG PDDEXK nuclease domain containing protein [Flavobacteriaceae bacterium]